MLYLSLRRVSLSHFNHHVTPDLSWDPWGGVRLQGWVHSGPQRIYSMTLALLSFFLSENIKIPKTKLYSFPP